MANDGQVEQLAACPLLLLARNVVATVVLQTSITPEPPAMPKPLQPSPRPAAESPESPAGGASFVKVYSSILNSSLWTESSDTRILWITLLAMCDSRGYVEAALSGLARRANISKEACEKGLAIFMSSDDESMNPANEGRRVEKWERGWRVLNYVEFRERRGGPEVPDDGRNYVYYCVAGDEVKIGTSKNPWARARDMRTTRPGVIVAAVERGGFRLERERHEQFKSARIAGEWFRLTPELQAHIAALRSNGSSDAVATVDDEDKEEEGDVENVVVASKRDTAPKRVENHGANVEKPDIVVLGDVSPREYSLPLTVALNQGLIDNPLVGESPNPALPYRGDAIAAAEKLIDAAVPLDFAKSHAYAAGRGYKPETAGDSIGSIAYVAPRVLKAWEREQARTAAVGAERPSEPRSPLPAGSNGGPVAVNGKNGNGARRDLKGEGMIVFGRIRDAVETVTVWDYPDREPGLRGSNRPLRRIRPDVLADLDGAAVAALSAIGGERAICYPNDEKQGADAHRWAFSAAYAAAAAVE